MVLASLLLAFSLSAATATEAPPVAITHISADGTVQDGSPSLTAIINEMFPTNNSTQTSRVDVQTSAKKTSQIAGGYRWQVRVEVSVKQAPPLADKSIAFTVPVVLQYEHLGELDAVRAATPAIERHFTQEWLQQID